MYGSDNESDSDSSDSEQDDDTKEFGFENNESNEGEGSEEVQANVDSVALDGYGIGNYSGLQEQAIYEEEN